MSFSIGSIFHSLSAEISKLFGGHAAQIQAAISDAKTVAGAASIVLTATGQTAAATEVQKINGALSIVAGAVDSETTADTLAQHAANLANLTTALVNSGDINVKNAQTQSTIAAVATKVQATVGALESAAVAATPAA